MEIQEHVQGLEKRMRTDYHYVDGEMASYLNFICTKEREVQGPLFSHLIQLHGMLETNGDRNDDTFINEKKWRKVVIGMKPKWDEIREKVAEAEPPLTPDQVGEIIAEAIGTEKKDVRKRALLSWVLLFAKPGFIPYVAVPELSQKALEVGPFDLDKLTEAVSEALQRVRAIRKSPVFKTPLMKTAALQEVLDGIEDPMQRAVVLAAYAHASGPRVETSIGIMGGMPGGLGRMLAEALSEFGAEHKCAECDIRHDCDLPPAEKWRAENA